MGLHCCVRAFSSCGKRGPLFIAVCGLLIVVASPVNGAWAPGTQASVVVACGLSCGSRALECRLSSCGAWAQLLHGMWDLPGPGLEPVSPALAGRFPTTVPPGKSNRTFLSPQKFSYTLPSYSLLSPHLPTTQLLFWFVLLQIKFACPRTSYKLDHRKCSFLCLVLWFNIKFFRLIHVAVCISSSFLLLLYRISLYRYTTSWLSIFLLMDIWLVWRYYE